MIIYFHGFGSTGSSKKVELLKDRFQNVVAPDLPFDPNEIKTLVESIVADFYKNNRGDKLVFVGTSLGGFYANYFAHLYDCPAVLVNPSLEPENTLRNRLGINTKYDTNEQFLVTEDHLSEMSEMSRYVRENYTGVLVNVFLAKDDIVLSYENAVKTLRFPNSIVVTEDGGHRYDKNWSKVMDQVEKILG